MTLAVADDADVTAATLGDGLTDGETHSRSLDKLVELDEAFEYRCLLVGGDALAGILAEEVEAVVLRLPAEADMTLGGELHGVGDEVGEHLLDAANVDDGGKMVVGTFPQEFHVGVLNALGQGGADVVEVYGEVGLLRFDGEVSVGDARRLDDVVDESLQHVGTVADDSHVLASFR